MKKVIVILAITAALALIVACAAPPQQAAPQPPAQPAQPVAQKGGAYTAASFAEAVSLNPLLTQDTASSGLQGWLYASLTRRDPKTLDVVGDLYDGTPTFNADGSKMTWKLRKGLKWSDGSPLTSADVVFTWQKMMDPNVKFPYRKLYSDAFKDVTADDELTVTYTLTQPGFCPAVINSGLPGPIPASVYKNLDINTADVNNKPTVTSGEYSLKEWVKDDHATFNPASKIYVRGEPNIDARTVRIVKDNTVATQMFKTQEIDSVGPDAKDWDEVSKLAHAQPFNYYSLTASWTYIGINLQHPFLKDKLVRQAISYAIDKKEFVDKIRQGHAQPQYSIYAPSSWAYTDDVQKYAFNPAKAKDLLKQAGWTSGADGILVKDGQPFKIRIHFNAGNKEREQIAIISQQYLKDVGISAEVLSEEWNAYLARVTGTGERTRDFELFVLGWSAGAEPNGQGNIWKSNGGQNDLLYNNPELDKLFEQGANVKGCSNDARKPAYVKIQQILADDAPYVFLYSNETLAAYNKRVHVNPLTSLGVGYDTQLWWLNQKTQ